MSRRAKGPRLWFNRKRKLWFILDRGGQRGTGLGTGASEADKDQALKAYLAKKHTADISIGTRDPSQILIDDVLAKYVRDVVMPDQNAGIPGHARPDETVARIQSLRGYFGGHTLNYVTGDTCREYAKSKRGTRRELEDLRSAINHHRHEGLHKQIISVTLPEKPASRERWLTRQEAAALIRAAWRFREDQGGPMAGRRTRKHVARFMVVARYMGSRAGVICSASIEKKRPPGRAWVDLRTGIFHGRPIGHRDTKKRRQTVPVPPPLLAHIRRWQANGQRYVVEWHGKPVSRVDKAHRSAVVDAGLGEFVKRGKKIHYVSDVTPHTWRHTVATWLSQKSTNTKQAAEWLAMSEQTYLRVYSKHDPSKFKDVHDAL